jgi:hypothetical protein
MPNTVRLKRSAVAGKVPATSDLQLGELAINTYDGKVYLKKNDGSDAIVEVGPREASIEFVIDGGGAAITTGIKGDVEIPFACTITSASLLADQSGSIVIDLWRDSYANFPPTVADTITASAKPTLSSAVKYQDSTLTGWTKNFAAGDILRLNVDSATTVQRVTLSLKVTR